MKKEEENLLEFFFFVGVKFKFREINVKNDIKSIINNYYIIKKMI